MERRTFMLSLLALPAAAVALKSEAKAAPVISSVPQASGPVPTQDAAVTLPDGTPVDYAQYRRRRRQRTVCTWRRNRYGRRVRVCRTIWY